MSDGDHGMPQGWSLAKTDVLRQDDAPIIYGILQPGPEQEEGVYYVRPTEIVDDVIQLASLRKTTQEIAKKYRRASLMSGDTLLSIVGTIGKVAAVPPELEGANITQSSVRIRTNNECIDAAFFRHALKSPVITQQFEKHRLGTGVPRLNVAHVRELDIPLPPLAEQRRIVAKIEALQKRSRKAREALAEVKPLLEQFRQSLLAAAFRGDLTADWREQHPDVEPASELLARIRKERREKWEQAELGKYEAKGKKPPKNWRDKYIEPEPVDDSGLPELPERWCWTTVDQIAEKVSDGVHKKPNYVTSGIPFITVKNLTRGPGISIEDTKFISEEDHQEFIKRTHPERGDILVTKDGATLGRVRLIETDLVFSIFVSVALIKPIEKAIAPFIVHALESPYGQEAMKVTGTGIPHIHLVDLRSTVVPLPPLAEQHAICKLVQSALEVVESLADVSNSLFVDVAQLDQSILAKAFRGELVPQDPNDEPASVLLERICQQREANKNGRPKRKGRSKAPSRTDLNQQRLDRGQVVLDILLLLDAWGKPVSIAPLEAALVLIRCPELRKSFLKARRRRKGTPAGTSGPLVNGLDRIYDYLVARKVIKRVGRHAYELLDAERIAGVSEADRDRAAEAIRALEKLMKVRDLDEEQAHHVVAEAIETPYEIGTTV